MDATLNHESIMRLINQYQQTRANCDTIGTLRLALYNIGLSSVSLWWNGDRGTYKLIVEHSDSKIVSSHNSLNRAVNAFLVALKVS